MDTYEGSRGTGRSGDLAAVTVRCEDLVHIYKTVGIEVIALRGVDLVVRQAETVAVLGPSGAGKSTLLWLLAGLRRPSAGRIWVDGQDFAALNPVELDRLRATRVGVLLQDPARNLVPYLTVVQNIAFAQRAASWRRKDARRHANDLLAAVGLTTLRTANAGRLSGGEQQRLGVAVALANRPNVLLADEPTSQLDRASGQRVVDLLRHVAAQYATTVIAVTHDERVSTALGRTVTIRHGRLGAEGRSGEEFVVVGNDGSVQLPPETRRVLPPGSFARVHTTAASVELHPADVEEPTA